MSIVIVSAFLCDGERTSHPHPQRSPSQKIQRSPLLIQVNAIAHTLLQNSISHYHCSYLAIATLLLSDRYFAVLPAAIARHPISIAISPKAQLNK